MASSLAAPPLPLFESNASVTSEAAPAWRLVHSEDAGVLTMLRDDDPPPVASTGRLCVLVVEHGSHRAAVAARNCDSAGKTHGGVRINGIVAVRPGRVRGGTHAGAGIHLRIGIHDVQLLRPSGHLCAHGCRGTKGFVVFIDGKQPTYADGRGASRRAPLTRDAFWSRVYLRVLINGLVLGFVATVVAVLATLALGEFVKYALDENSLLREESHGADRTAGGEEGPGGSDAPSEPDEARPFLKNPVSAVYLLVVFPPAVAIFFIVAGARGLARHSARCRRWRARAGGAAARSAAANGEGGGARFALDEDDALQLEYHVMPGACTAAELDAL